MIETSIIPNFVYILHSIHLQVGQAVELTLDDQNGAALRYHEVAPILKQVVFPIFRMLSGQEYTCKPCEESSWWYEVIIERVA